MLPNGSPRARRVSPLLSPPPPWPCAQTGTRHHGFDGLWPPDTFVFTVRQRGRRGQLLSGVRDHRSFICSQPVHRKMVF